MSNPYSSPQFGSDVYSSGSKGKGGGPKPKNYLVESIILLICCGGLFAIPAIVFAAQVDSKYNSGDFSGAQASSDKAKMWCIIALCIGLVCGGLGAAIQILAIMAEAGNAGL